MYASIKVISGASKDEVTRKGNGELLVKVTAARERGKANKKMLRLLADYYGVPVSGIEIVKGAFHSRKVIAIRQDRQGQGSRVAD